jgi:hypothetical protein
MNKHLIAIPARPTNNLTYFSLHQEKARSRKKWWHFSWLLGDIDYREGKRDARRSPSNWNEALHGVRTDEERKRDNISSTLNQAIEDSRKVLVQYPALHDQNKQQIEEMKARGGLLPEVEAKNLRSSAKMARWVANILLVVEIIGLFTVAKATFGAGVVGPFCTAVLFVALIAILTKLALSRASGRLKDVLFWGCIVVGGLLAFSGLIGFAILRATTFNANLMGGVINYSQLSMGNALLMVGLTLGIPLIIGALHDDATEKHTKANNSMNLYDDRTELQVSESAWQRTLSMLEEYEKKVDPITESIIRDRKSSYRQGFHRGAAGKPEAAPYLKELMATGR